MASSLPSSSSNTASPESSETLPPSASAPKAFSCVLCAQRKVKCDKRPKGCANCAKARVPCIYKAPPPPRRRRKGMRELDTSARLKLCEDALRKLGVNPDELEKEEISKLSPLLPSATVEKPEGRPSPDCLEDKRAAHDSGVLVTGHGKSVYLENALWTTLRPEFRDSNEILDESSEDENYRPKLEHLEPNFVADGSQLLTGTPSSSAGLRHLHPQPVQIFKFWQVYLSNINPLVKIFHTPTIQQVILDASGNMDEIPRNTEALLFALYSVVLMSLSETECDAIMGQPKIDLELRYRAAAQHALLNANFLRSNDIMVLQALVLFLLSIGQSDARTLWILTGVALRIGQRLGLHRDGKELGLPPFETEIRRRIWWQIMFVDGHAEKLAGTGSAMLTMGTTNPPSNLNDSDLYHGMKELPKEHEGPTEMMFFLIRCHVGEFLRRSKTMNVYLQEPRATDFFDGYWNKLSTGAVPLASKDKAIDELDALFQQKYVPYFDPSIPWHFHCKHLCKSIVSAMRFMAHSHSASDPKAPQSEKDVLFQLSLQLTSNSNLAYVTPAMQPFVWHVNAHFQWKAFIYLISQLQHRTSGPQVEQAWKEVELAFDFHPNFSRELSKKRLPVAIGNLTLKSWSAYAKARKIPAGAEPIFIQVIRARRGKKDNPSPSSIALPPPAAYGDPADLCPNDIQPHIPPSLPTNANTSDAAAALPMHADLSAALNVDLPDAAPLLLDPEQINWEAWDTLVSDMQMQDAGGMGWSTGWEGGNWDF